MSKYYILFLSPDVIHKTIFYDQPRINLNRADEQLQVDDKILLGRNSAKGGSLPDGNALPDGDILPFVYTVTYVNRGAGTVTLQLEEQYNQTVVQVADIYFDIVIGSRYTSNGSYTLTRGDFERIIGRMGGKRMEEKALLAHIQNYIKARGYYFDDETIL